MLVIVGNRKVTDDVISTIMCRVEQILNSRLLINFSDVRQLLRILTLSDIHISEEYLESLSDIHISEE